MKNKWRIVSLVLVVLMAVSLFAGCNGGTGKKETTPAVQQGTTTPPVTAEATTTEPALRTFGKRTFAIAGGALN